jgi:hypothetical protein
MLINQSHLRQLLMLHLVSDSVIFLSYLSISCSLAWLLYKLKREIAFAWIFVAFGAFILACGFTHALDVVVLWKPLYWLSGDMKLITAIASMTTAVALPCLFPGIRKLLDAAASSKINASRFLAISESSNDGFYLLESVRDAVGEIIDFRFIYLNDKGARLISSTPESMRGQLLCVQFPVNKMNGLFEEYKYVVETGKRFDLVSPFDVKEIKATWLHLQVMKVADGAAGAVTAGRRNQPAVAADRLPFFVGILVGIGCLAIHFSHHGWSALDLRGRCVSA